MKKPIADIIKDIVTATRPDGEVKVKIIDTPEVKPPRRRSPLLNKSDKPDYGSGYMDKRRQDGEDDQAYQKIPDNLKELKKEQKKKLKEKFDL